MEELVKADVTSFSEEVDTGRDMPPSERNRHFLEPTENVCMPRSISKKTIALAILKAAYPQIPCWVHFIFKVQNPIHIYMFTSIEYISNALGFHYIEVRLSIEHVHNLEVKTITRPSLAINSGYNYYDLPLKGFVSFKNGTKISVSFSVCSF